MFSTLFLKPRHNEDIVRKSECFVSGRSRNLLHLSRGIATDFPAILMPNSNVSIIFFGLKVKAVRVIPGYRHRTSYSC